MLHSREFNQATKPLKIILDSKQYEFLQNYWKLWEEHNTKTSLYLRTILFKKVKIERSATLVTSKPYPLFNSVSISIFLLLPMLGV